MSEWLDYTVEQTVLTIVQFATAGPDTCPCREPNFSCPAHSPPVVLLVHTAQGNKDLGILRCDAGACGGSRHFESSLGVKQFLG